MWNPESQAVMASPPVKLLTVDSTLGFGRGSVIDCRLQRANCNAGAAYPDHPDQSHRTISAINNETVS